VHSLAQASPRPSTYAMSRLSHDVIARGDVAGSPMNVEPRSIVQTQAFATQNYLASAYFPYWISDDDNAILRREDAHRTISIGVEQKEVSNENNKPPNFATEKYIQNASEYASVLSRLL
jgi:hypothetical protein